MKSHVHWREVHLAWREQHGVDAILQTPQSSFAEIKKFAPHLFLGFDRSGNVIFLQRPGLIDFKSLQKSDISSAGEKIDKIEPWTFNPAITTTTY